MEERGGEGAWGGAASESRDAPLRERVPHKRKAHVRVGEEERREERRGPQLLDEEGHEQMVKILLTSITS